MTPDDPAADLSAAHMALQEFASGPARRAADEIGEAFDRAGARIAGALGRAAHSGELSFKRLAKTALEELARVALHDLFGKGGAPFFGARASGGSVNAGGAYLVGERGPELFAPRQSGTIIPAATAPVSVHFYFGGGADATAIARHQGQIAAQVARAVAYGRRNL